MNGRQLPTKNSPLAFNLEVVLENCKKYIEKQKRRSCKKKGANFVYGEPDECKQ